MMPTWLIAVSNQENQYGALSGRLPYFKDATKIGPHTFQRLWPKYRAYLAISPSYGAFESALKKRWRNPEQIWFASPRRFAGYGVCWGRVQLVVVKAGKRGGFKIDHQSSFLKSSSNAIHSNTVSRQFNRDGKSISPEMAILYSSHTTKSFFLTAQRDVTGVMSELRRWRTLSNALLLRAVATWWGVLAQSLEKEYRVKSFERDPERCRYLSETLTTRLVLNVMRRDRVVLEENIESHRVFSVHWPTMTSKISWSSNAGK